MSDRHAEEAEHPDVAFGGFFAEPGKEEDGDEGDGVHRGGDGGEAFVVRRRDDVLEEEGDGADAGDEADPEEETAGADDDPGPVAFGGGEAVFDGERFLLFLGDGGFLQVEEGDDEEGDGNDGVENHGEHVAAADVALAEGGDEGEGGGADDEDAEFGAEHAPAGEHDAFLGVGGECVRGWR